MTPHREEDIPELCNKTFLNRDEYIKDNTVTMRWIIGIFVTIMIVSVTWAVTQTAKVSSLEMQVKAQSETITKIEKQNTVVIDKIDRMVILLQNLK